MSFKKIYNSAINQDSLALTEALKDVCIDVLGSDGIHTPVSLLAYEGKKDAVNWLLRRDASEDQAVFGFAAGGHVEEVNILIDHNENEAAKGYALGGYVEEVDALLAKGANENDAIFGYALGGHKIKVTELLKSNTKMSAIAGYALGGHSREVDALAFSSDEWQTAVYHYALAGNVAEVDSIINVPLYIVLKGYACGGLTAKVNEILFNSRDDELDDKVVHVVYSYAKGGHIADVNVLLDFDAGPRYVSTFKKHDLRVVAVNGYRAGKHLSTALLRFIFLTEDKKLREKIIQLEESDPIEQTIIHKKLEQLNKLVSTSNHISPDLVNSYFKADKSLYVWLIDCRIFFKNHTGINYDTFFEIASYLLNVPRKSLEKLCEVILKQISSKNPRFLENQSHLFNSELTMLEQNTTTIDVKKTTLDLKIENVAKFYEKYVSERCDFTFFHFPGQAEKKRVDKFVKEILILDTEAEKQKKLIEYIGDSKNGTAHPISLRNILLDTYLLDNDLCNDDQTLERLKDTAKNFNRKLIELSKKWSEQEPKDSPTLETRPNS